MGGGKNGLLVLNVLLMVTAVMPRVSVTVLVPDPTKFPFVSVIFLLPALSGPNVSSEAPDGVVTMALASLVGLSRNPEPSSAAMGPEDVDMPVQLLNV